MRRLTALSAILLGGAIAGTLDITYAIGFQPCGRATHSHSAIGGERFAGRAGFSGGLPTAALGLVLHFCIALSAAAIFYLAEQAIPVLTHHPVVAGLFYGFLIYAAMNLIVLPLSAIRARSPSATGLGHGTVRSHVLYRPSNLAGGAPDYRGV